MSEELQQQLRSQLWTVANNLRGQYVGERLYVFHPRIHFL